ncbi:MAG: Gfo/Idh/MocA family oxidoreductase [Spirochaetales bacterium]|nr:Gfo/Idh/MocA family oxidoreductase [Spirochaetales bacterium]
MSQPVTAVIVGAGHRALIYASLALENPELLTITGVADPSPASRQLAADMFHIPPERCWSSAEELAALPRQADAVINGTMDHQHVPTSLPLLKKGYHILLEKPFAVSEVEMDLFSAAAAKAGVTVNICHVLRYAPFYQSINREIRSGVLGEILNIQASEHVSYHHMAVSYVRGKWNNTAACRSSMLMAKCCHDLDLLVWLQSGNPPAEVSSSGSRQFFREEKAPAGSGTRCLTDCACEAECDYSARKHYLDHPDRWSFYVWDELKNRANPTLEEKEALLRGDSPYGRCVFRCDNDVVDHQSVVIGFGNGSTATLNMVGGCARPERKIHVIGTKGELEGVLEEGRYALRLIDPRPGREYDEKIVDLNLAGDFSGVTGGHGGGDLALAEDFVRTIRGEQPSPSSTSLADSVYGHRLGFLAEKARLEKRVITLT